MQLQKTSINSIEDTSKPGYRPTRRVILDPLSDTQKSQHSVDTSAHTISSSICSTINARHCIHLRNIEGLQINPKRVFLENKLLKNQDIQLALKYLPETFKKGQLFQSYFNLANCFLKVSQFGENQAQIKRNFSAQKRIRLAKVIYKEIAKNEVGSISKGRCANYVLAQIYSDENNIKAAINYFFNAAKLNVDEAMGKLIKIVEQKDHLQNIALQKLVLLENCPDKWRVLAAKLGFKAHKGDSACKLAQIEKDVNLFKDKKYQEEFLRINHSKGDLAIKEGIIALCQRLREQHVGIYGYYLLEAKLLEHHPTNTPGYSSKQAAKSFMLGQLENPQVKANLQLCGSIRQYLGR